MYNRRLKYATTITLSDFFLLSSLRIQVLLSNKRLRPFTVEYLSANSNISIVNVTHNQALILLSPWFCIDEFLCESNASLMSIFYKIVEHKFVVSRQEQIIRWAYSTIGYRLLLNSCLVSFTFREAPHILENFF